MGAPEILFALLFTLAFLAAYALGVTLVRRSRRDPDPRSTYDDEFWGRP